MTQAVTARQQGDDFQGRWFWLHAARLLKNDYGIDQVWFEDGPRSFDDVSIVYKQNEGPRDAHGRLIDFDLHQCKWHTTHGSFTYKDLCNPKFINAETVCFLRRAHNAWRQQQAEQKRCRLKLVTNWQIHPDDPLRKVVRTGSGNIDLELLFSTKTSNSAFGKIRQCWCERLGVNENELCAFLESIVFAIHPNDLDDIRDRLDNQLRVVGMRPVPQHAAAYIYDDLIRKLHAQKRTRFNREKFKHLCKQENLFDTSPSPTLPIYGIRSFLHATDDMERRCDSMLDLVSLFDGRSLRSDYGWNEHIFPQLQPFISGALSSASNLRFIIEAHASIAFAVGSLVGSKHGRQLEIEQRLGVGGTYSWAADKGDLPSTPFSDLEAVKIGSGGESAVAVSITHDVFSDVERYAHAQIPEIGQIISVRPTPNPSRGAIISGAHAWKLAEKIAAELRRFRVHWGPLHLFIAGPNAFAFFLGQFKTILGPIQLYEFDFEGNTGYQLALKLD